jgi:MFS family permease
VTFRAVQGAGGALLYLAALGIVVQTFPLRQRGRALALFFGVAGALTALGPVVGGYLIEGTWRAIFWVNIPVGLAALLLIAVLRPETGYRPAPVDYRGLALIASGIGLSVFGSHQLSVWGWANPPTGGSSAMAAIPRFVRADLAQASQTVCLVMAGIMAAAALVALTGLRAGRQEEPGESGTVRGSQTPHGEAGARP